MTTRTLLALWVGTLRELRRRNVVRTANNPIGDIAEELVARHVGGERASFSQAAWDVKGPDGELLQVKALRRTAKGRRAFSPLRSSDYDAVVLVVFSEDLTLEGAWKVPRATVERLAKHNAHVNGRIVRLSARLFDDPTVERIDLTDAFLDGPATGAG